MYKKTKLVLLITCLLFLGLFVFFCLKKDNGKINQDQNSEIIIEKDGVRFSTMSYERFDTPEEYKKYIKDAWYCELIPDEAPDIYYIEYVDLEGLYDADPEYEDMEKNPEKYSIDEMIAKMDEIDKIFDDYVTVKNEKYDFIFVECLMENEKDIDIEFTVNDINLIKSMNNDDWLEYEMGYFDNSSKNNDDVSYFVINIPAKTKIEFTVAYAIPEKEDNANWYIGIPDVIVDSETEIQLNPTEQTMYVKKIEME